MKFTPNIGVLNALIRITLGFTYLSWATAKLVKKPWRQSYLFVVLMASMKIAEGILRYCPLTEACKMMMENYTEKDEEQENTLAPHNPT